MAVTASIFKADKEVQPAQQFLMDAARMRTPLHDFYRRGDCEDRVSLRQPIPYIMLRRKAVTGHEYLLYERAGGEGRLHGKLSVGIGGHVNEVDCGASVFSAIMNAARRELVEECGAAFEDVDVDLYAAVQGLIIHDVTEVDRVHAGILFVVDVPRDICVEPSNDLINMRWVAAAELRTLTGSMEAWSQAAVRCVLGSRAHGFQQLAADTFCIGELNGAPLNITVTATDGARLTIDIDSKILENVSNAYLASNPA